jgi:hypothetical protein
MVFISTFNNISVISWQSVLLVAIYKGDKEKMEVAKYVEDIKNNNLNLQQKNRLL